MNLEPLRSEATPHLPSPLDHGTFITMTKRRKRAILIVVGLMIAFPVAGRLHAWWAAVRYGHTLGYAFVTLGKNELGNTAGLRDFLEGPELKIYYNRAHGLAFLGGGYTRRIDAFKGAMYFLSQQASLPLHERTAPPPLDEYFKITLNDRSTQGIADAVSRLISDYQSQTRIP
jgi:hypothetical protein